MDFPDPKPKPNNLKSPNFGAFMSKERNQSNDAASREGSVAKQSMTMLEAAVDVQVTALQKISSALEDATAKVITPKKNMPAIFKAPKLPA